MQKSSILNTACPGILRYIIPIGCAGQCCIKYWLVVQDITILHTNWFGRIIQIEVQDSAILNTDWLWRTILNTDWLYRKKKSRAVGTYHLSYISDCRLQPTWVITCSWGFCCTYHAQYFSYFPHSLSVDPGHNEYPNSNFIICIQLFKQSLLNVFPWSNDLKPFRFSVAVLWLLTLISDTS